MTSHALGGLAGGWGTLLHQRVAGGRHGRYLERMMSYQKSDCVNRCVLLDEQFCQISSRWDLKQRSLRLFEERRPNKNKKNNKMRSDMRSVSDLK